MSPKKSKWTTVNKSESPIKSKRSNLEYETNINNLQTEQNIINKEEEIVKEEPNFKPSGVLAKETNTVK